VEVGGTKLRVPAGVKDGARIKVAGKGGRAPSGGRAGDLYVRIHVAPHPLFTLDGDGNLVVRVPVTITEAALGTKIQVPTLDDVVTLKVPAGTRAGKTLRVKGKGAPRPSGGKGDLLVKVEVEVPQNLTKRERELLEAFASTHQASPRAHLESWISERRAADKRAS
jgi:molecular chaperone DnaJ